MHDSGDALSIKLLVAVVWIFDTLHASFMSHVLYYYLITNYGNLMSLEYVVWSFPTSSLMNAVVVLAVQCFFARQIYNLCRPQVKWWVTTAILFFATAQFGFGIGTQVLEYSNLSNHVHRNIDLPVCIGSSNLIQVSLRKLGFTA